MDRSETITTAFGNLGRHKLRTSLTMLGMVFGVGAVIAMLSIGAGAEKKALEAIGKLGLRNVIVRAKQVKPEDRQELRKKSLGVSLRDGEAIMEAVPNIERVLPRVEVKAYKIIAPGAKTKGKVLGVSWRYREVADVGLAEGRFFDARDEHEHAQVAVIGPEIRRNLFGYGPVLGKQLKVNDVWLEIVGVLAADSSGAPQASATDAAGSQSTAREIWIPVSTAMRKFDRDPLDAPVDELLVTVKEGVSTRRTGQVIEPLLQRLHGGADDYEVVIPEALLEQSRQTQRIFNIVMGSIAGISLLVGGIGIMNIMLASVLERTREIGVRRAIGATRRDIRSQFVIESFAISFLGGVTGIVIGIVLARIVAAYAGWPTVITIWSLVLSTGVSITVGLVSGIYPAARAAELNPVEALRYE
ncbi:MAG TPA: ABC transporter permease [Thermoanaerobaculia bacterium]|jgi:putative ABC transport system permease protein|nr:ABC transporter permease [Thermoanaerobaculia bacterium]